MPREPDVFGQPTSPRSVERRAHDARDRRAPAATRRRAPDRDRRAARRDGRGRRRAPDADAVRGTRGSPSTASAAASRGTTSSAVRPDGNCSVTTSIHCGRDCRRALLVEELVADAVGIAHEHVRPVRRRRAARPRRPPGSSGRGRAWCSRPPGTAPCRVGDRHLAAAGRQHFSFRLCRHFADYNEGRAFTA